MEKKLQKKITKFSLFLTKIGFSRPAQKELIHIGQIVFPLIFSAIFFTLTLVCFVGGVSALVHSKFLSSCLLFALGMPVNATLGCFLLNLSRKEFED